MKSLTRPPTEILFLGLLADIVLDGLPKSGVCGEKKKNLQGQTEERRRAEATVWTLEPWIYHTQYSVTVTIFIQRIVVGMNRIDCSLIS
jgi:hypothetical protein